MCSASSGVLLDGSLASAQNCRGFLWTPFLNFPRVHLALLFTRPIPQWLFAFLAFCYLLELCRGPISPLEQKTLFRALQGGQFPPHRLFEWTTLFIWMFLFFIMSLIRALQGGHVPPHHHFWSWNWFKLKMMTLWMSCLSLAVCSVTYFFIRGHFCKNPGRKRVEFLAKFRAIFSKCPDIRARQDLSGRLSHTESALNRQLQSQCISFRYLEHSKVFFTFSL